MSSLDMGFKCARCDKELVVAPPVLFKHPALTIFIMRCDCKDEDISQPDKVSAEEEIK